MYLGIFIVELVAVISIGFAIAISRGNIGLIHDYHRKNVKDSDKMAYAKLYAKGLLVIAMGCFLSGIFMYFEKGWGIGLSIFIGLTLGFYYFNMAQRLYNGAWFS